MRVLHVTSSFPRSARDHVAPFLLDLVRAQREVGIEPVVVAPHDAGARLVEELDGVVVRRFRYAPDRREVLAYRGGLLARTRSSAVVWLPLFLASMALAVLRAVRRDRPDVVHAHWWLPGALCALPAARLLRVPLVVTLHGSDVHLLRLPLVGRLGVAVLCRADVVAVVSDDLRRVLLERTGPRLPHVVVLRLPVEQPHRPPAPPPPSPPVRLLAAGRLTVEKGFDVLLEALTIAVERGADAHLLLVGSGPEEERLARLAQPLGPRVVRRPALPREELWRALDHVHALVVPSRREGLGLVALEALLRGRPVIASRTGGLPEVVGPGDGLLVPADDPVALAEAIGTLPLPAPTVSAAARHLPHDVGLLHLAAYERLVLRPRT